MQGLAQHGQHPLSLPDRAQLAQLIAARIKRFLMLGQPAQLVQAQANGAGGQGGTHQAQVLGRGHRPQPVHQILGLCAVKDRVFV